MREIKFRQPLFNRDGTFNSWHYWGWVRIGNFVSPLSMGHNVKGVFGLQYTGLKDRNGVKIYEGDIVRRINKKSCCGKINYTIGGVVEWFAEGWVVRESSDEVGGCGWANQKEEEIEIIGNIYENPELVTT